MTPPAPLFRYRGPARLLSTFFFMIPIFIIFSFHLFSIDCLIIAASDSFVSISIDILASSLLFSSTFCNLHSVLVYSLPISGTR